VLTEEAVEIWDALTLKFISTPKLTKHTTKFKGKHGVAYSPDGYLLAGCSETAIIIWDTQTGGEVTKITHGITSSTVELMWSLDGKTIAIVSELGSHTHSVHTCSVASGKTLSLGILRPEGHLCIWVHNESFQIAMTTGDS
jgi:WD40 repeat protein